MNSFRLSSYFIEQLLKSAAWQIKATDDRLIDSVPVTLARGTRANRGRVAPELAETGFCATKQQHDRGVKRHFIAARRRGAGGGSQFAHELPDQLLMLLIYYRLYLTQEFLTLLFKHQHKSRISRNIKQMRDLFEAVLPTHAQALKKVLALAKKRASASPETYRVN